MQAFRSFRPNSADEDLTRFKYLYSNNRSLVKINPKNPIPFWRRKKWREQIYLIVAKKLPKLDNKVF